MKGLLILTVILGHAIQEPLKVRGISFEDNIWRNIIYSSYASFYGNERLFDVSSYWGGELLVVSLQEI